MRPLWVVAAFALSVPAVAQPREDPRAISIHPFVGQRGSIFFATLRGSGLSGKVLARFVMPEDWISLAALPGASVAAAPIPGAD